MTNDNDSATKHYKVGYKKPPKLSQFKKGISGNKKGRPKKIKDPQTGLSTSEILKKVLNDTISVSDGHCSKVITKGEAMITQLVTKAINGDLQAIKQLQPLMAECNLLLPGPPTTPQESEPVKGMIVHLCHRDAEGNSVPIEPAATNNETVDENEE